MRQIKYSHWKTNTFSAQLCLCNNGPFPPDLLFMLAAFNSLYGFNELYLFSSGSTQKSPLFSSSLAWFCVSSPLFYENSPSVSSLVGTSVTAYPVLPWKSFSHYQVLSKKKTTPPLQRTAPTKKHAVTNRGLNTIYNMQTKMLLKDTLNHCLICHTQNDNRYMKNFLHVPSVFKEIR